MSIPCEAEIGSPSNGWHNCNRPASIEVIKCYVQGGCSLLYYCDKHANRATQNTSKAFSKIEVKRINKTEGQE